MQIMNEIFLYALFFLILSTYSSFYTFYIKNLKIYYVKA